MLRRLQIILLAFATCLLPLRSHAQELIRNGRFDSGKGEFWQSGDTDGGVTMTKEKGELCATVRGGTDKPWKAQIGVGGLRFIAGRTYVLSGKITGSAGGSLSLLVQRDSEPYGAHLARTLHLPLPGDVFSTTFIAENDRPASLIFQLGGAPQSFDLCLDDISLREAAANMPARKSAVRVNQAGYLLDGPKRATIVSDSEKPLVFELSDAEGRSVFKGMTRPLGFDALSGLKTHLADFSSYRTAGASFTLAVADDRSLEFSIGKNPYDRLSVDAQSWFYPARSGIEIKADVAGKAYARPAGHLGVFPNKGDINVPCLERKTASSGCDYRLDVRGGWYDAGDQGKYVVNGGIAVSQLMDTLERGKLYANNSANVLSDERARLPESRNGVPDILDEARWELEFLMRMMVPDDDDYAGMVHHKVHDTSWTAAPMLPHLDPEPRALYAPSTAATLNLAAAAAQGSRLFKTYDKAFSAALLESARKAWTAAQKYPAIFAPPASDGGGAYDDVDVSDEFYWAAAELYLATGEKDYLSVLKNSPHWSGDVFVKEGHGAFDWAGTAGLGRLHLALYGKSLLPEKGWKEIAASVVAAAKTFLALQSKEPFGQIYHPENGKYDWGSNHLILQNMIVVSAAYDLSPEPAFLEGVRESMDYILGRNAMNMSYITGYGIIFSRNQHSRWFANQLDDTLPNPPPGSLAGGPNSHLDDKVSLARLGNCPAQQCYIDDIDAYSTNEMTINWNAPLVYIAGFLSDTAMGSEDSVP